MTKLGFFCTALALSGCVPMSEETVPAVTASKLEGMLFIANKRDASLSQVSLATGEEVRRADSCANPHELAVSPDRRHVALVCYSGSGIEIFDAATLEKVKAIELGKGARPHGILWHDSGRIVATAEGRGTIFTIDDALSTKPLVHEIGTRGGEGPHMVVVNAEATKAWGTIIPLDTVVAYDLIAQKEIGRVRLSGRTEGIALTPDGEALFVGTLMEHKLFRLDPDTLKPNAEIATGRVPIRVMAHPGGRYLVTSDLQDGALSVIDADINAVVRTIPVSGSEDEMQVTVIFSPDGKRLYVAETATDTVAEIDFASGKLLRRLRGGPGGDGLAVTG